MSREEEIETLKREIEEKQRELAALESMTDEEIKEEEEDSGESSVEDELAHKPEEEAEHGKKEESEIPVSSGREREEASEDSEPGLPAEESTAADRPADIVVEQRQPERSEHRPLRIGEYSRFKRR